MADASVRSARAADAPAIAAVQGAAWRAAYPDLLPTEAIEGALAGAPMWQRAIDSPPTPRHRVLVAVSGEEVTGFAGFGPSDDPDRDPDVDAELLALSVDPGRSGEGHGSRLVNAAVDHLRADGFRTVSTWVPDLDGDPLARFLAGAGWRPDGAIRRLELDGGRPAQLTLLRLQAVIGDPA